MVKPAYEARAARRGRWWSIDIRQLNGVHAQARRLDQVDSMAREAVAMALEAEIDSFDVVVHVDYASLGVLKSTVEEAVRAREAADTAQSRATHAMRRAVSGLRSAGYTARDAGMLLGVSNQRISQIERQLADNDAGEAHSANVGGTE